MKGIRNGEGIEYDNNKNIIFEGQYLNGKKSYGIEYDNYQNIIYEGEYSNGKRIEKYEELDDDYDEDNKYYKNEYTKGKNSKKSKKK